MSDQNLDIFESDSLFIEFASSILLGIGLVMLPLGLSCKLLDWGFCGVQIVPLFVNVGEAKMDLTAINLPLAMIILGFAARLYTRFGWIVCVLLLGLLSVFFSFLLYMLYIGRLAYINSGATASEAIGEHSYIEAMVANAGLGLLCLGAIGYLVLPGVRKLYWRSGFFSER